MTFKPYRLINDPELKMLQQEFDNKLQRWNDEHAMFPLTSILGRSTQHADFTRDLSIIKQSLFGDESNCFNALTETLFKELLNQLLGTQLLDPIEDWFYTGTPALTLTLCCAGKTMTLYLHPQWVLNALASENNPKKPISTLHQALSAQHIDLHIELNPVPLKLTDIARLSVGDIIKTDHPITKPAKLSHQQKPICSVDIGESNSFKSIQIARET